MTEYAIGNKVYQWPEFKAFRKRLGVPDLPRENACTIRVAWDEEATVIQEYVAEDTNTDE